MNDIEVYFERVVEVGNAISREAKCIMMHPRIQTFI